MRRKLAFLEGTLYAGGVIANNVVTTVTIRGIFSRESLNKALDKVQRRHPLLNVHIEHGDDGTPYFVQNTIKKDIDVRVVDRSGDEDWKDEFVKECLISFDAVNSLLLRIVWIKGNDFSDLIFVGHHCICDGRSILNLVHETLHVLGDPEMDIGTYNQFSAILDFVPTYVKRNRANRMIAKCLPVLTKIALRFASFKKEISRNSPYFIHWKLSVEESKAIFEQCKVRGLSIHAFFCAVFLRAFGDVEGRKRQLKLFCSIDMRRFIKEVKNDMLFAFPAMVPLHLNKNPSRNVWQQAEVLKTTLSRRIEKLSVYDTLAFSEGLTTLIPQITEYAKKDKGTHAFTFSNMGLVQLADQYNGLIVENLYSPASIFALGNPSTLSITCFKAQIDFMFTSDENFLPHASAQAFQTRALEIIRTSL
ncbi:condensation domain-containing protein [Olivibacter sp. CPCC 100613]|uniref:condensation domain-containing protein n=1 Tax=Olivibacter sp. CPCC 100613 TaxID=3079931 RepID=UPI002FF6DC0A